MRNLSTQRCLKFKVGEVCVCVRGTVRIVEGKRELPEVAGSASQSTPKFEANWNSERFRERQTQRRCVERERKREC